MVRTTAIILLLASVLISGCASTETSTGGVRIEGAAGVSGQQAQVQRKAYQQLTDALQREIKSAHIQVKRGDGNIKITVSNDILFPDGGWTMPRKGKELLDRIIPVLKGLRGQVIDIYAFTDNGPIPQDMKKRFSTNRELSVVRAADVAGYMEEKGISQELLSATGFGPEQPLAPNDTPQGRAKNRRVEIVIMALD